MALNQKGKNILCFIILIILFSIIFFMIYIPRKMNERANEGKVSKAMIWKMIRLPKGGLSLHVKYSVNNLENTGYINTDIKYLNFFSVGDSIFIKYDTTDLSNAILITDSIN